MNYTFRRQRSDFWVNVYENDYSYTILTNKKYVTIIDYCCPYLRYNNSIIWKKVKKMKI